MPEDLLDAINRGELSEQQLRSLIEREADLLGMSLSEALELGEKRSLPNDPVGSDLQLLIDLLAA